MSDGNREDACEASVDENREGERKKAFMSFSSPATLARGGRVNYGRGREQENINLTLILNSDFRSSPSFSLLSSCWLPTQAEQRALFKFSLSSSS